MTYWELKEVEKVLYRDRARKILYPGLEPAYKQHDKLIETLANALHKCDQLCKEGRL